MNCSAEKRRHVRTARLWRVSRVLGRNQAGSGDRAGLWRYDYRGLPRVPGSCRHASWRVTGQRAADGGRSAGHGRRWPGHPGRRRQHTGERLPPSPVRGAGRDAFVASRDLVIHGPGADGDHEPWPMGMPGLNGSLFVRLRHALGAAFQEDELDVFLYTRLGRDLASLAPSQGAFAYRVFQLTRCLRNPAKQGQPNRPQRASRALNDDARRVSRAMGRSGDRRRPRGRDDNTHRRQFRRHRRRRIRRAYPRQRPQVHQPHLYSRGQRSPAESVAGSWFKAAAAGTASCADRLAVAVPDANSGTVRVLAIAGVAEAVAAQRGPGSAGLPARRWRARGTRPGGRRRRR
jgi:hypothetical protein